MSNCAALTYYYRLLLQQQTTKCRRISRHIPICVFVLCFRNYDAATYLRCLPITAYYSYCVYLGACRFALIFLRAFLVCRFTLNSARFSFLPKFITSYVWRFVMLLRF